MFNYIFILPGVNCIHIMNYIQFLIFLQLAFIVGFDEAILPEAIAQEVHTVIMCLVSLNDTLRKTLFTLADLDDLAVQVGDLQDCLKKTFGKYSKTELANPKVHSLEHFPEWIALYGAPCGWDTATYEQFHKTAAKFPWRHVSKKLDCGQEMLAIVDSRNLIAQLVQDDEDKEHALMMAHVGRSVSIYLVNKYNIPYHLYLSCSSLS
jgi:hypothetical protein